MKSKIILLFILFFSAQQLVAQLGISRYHLKGQSVSVGQFNPAEYSDHKINLAIPVLSGVSIDIDNFSSYSRILSTIDSDKILITDRFITDLRNNNRIHANIEVNLFSFGFNKSNGFSMNIFSNLKTDITTELPVDVLQLIIDGWGGDNIGKTAEGSLYAETNVYAEVGLGLKKDFFDEKLIIGANFKYLHSILYGGITDKVDISVGSDAQTYDLDFNYSSYGFVRMLSEGDDMKPNLEKGIGGALDVGIVYDFYNEIKLPLKFSFAVLDVYSAIFLEDVDVSSADDAPISVVLNSESYTSDFISTLIPTTTTTKKDMEVTLPRKFLGSLTYDLTNRDAFYLTSFYKSYNDGYLINTFGFGYSRTFWGDKFTLTGNLIKKSNNEDYLFGLSASLRMGALQFYVASDNIATFFDVSASKYQNISFGFNLVFDRRSLYVYDEGRSKVLEWGWGKAKK